MQASWTNVDGACWSEWESQAEGIVSMLYDSKEANEQLSKSSPALEIHCSLSITLGW